MAEPDNAQLAARLNALADILDGLPGGWENDPPDLRLAAQRLEGEISEAKVETVAKIIDPEGWPDFDSDEICSCISCRAEALLKQEAALVKARAAIKATREARHA